MSDKLEAYFKFKIKSLANKSFVLDQQEFDDLEVQSVLDTIVNCKTPIGKQVAYAMLRGVLPSVKLKLTSAYFNETNISYLNQQLGHIQHEAGYDFVSLFEVKNGNSAFTYGLSIFFAVANIGFVIALLLGLNSVIPLVLSVLASFLLHYRSKLSLGTYLDAFRYLKLTLVSARRISRDKKIKEIDQINYDFELKELKSIEPKLSIIGIEHYLQKDPSNISWYFAELVKVVLQLEPIFSHQLLKHLVNCRHSLESLYVKLAALDISIAIHDLISNGKAVVANIDEQRHIEFEGMYHPLIQNPKPNNFHFSESAIITGSNMSGKSSFIKSVGLNIVFGLGLGICFAESATIRSCKVQTLFNVKDSIAAGRSLFENEVYLLKKLLDKVDFKMSTHIVLFDELFKGTNNLERMALTASVLNYLSERGALILATTHDTPLISLLNEHIEQYYFPQRLDNTGLYFDYELQKGVAPETNAIDILRHYNMPQDLIRKANYLKSKLK